jgi:hypothetical protein
MYRIPIDLTASDLKSLNSDLQGRIGNASSYFMPGELPSVERDEALVRLARTGAYAFNSIFADGTPRETIRRALRDGCTVQITSEDFFVPWELLFDGPLDEHIDLACFWGTRYVISRALILTPGPGGHKSPGIVSKRPRVGVAAYWQLKHVADAEIPYLRALHKSGKITLSELASLDPSNPVAGHNALGLFLRQPRDIAHFACHAIEKAPLSNSCLVLSDEFEVTLEDFVVEKYVLTNEPFVILNACKTGTMDPLVTSNWAALFSGRGARGVMATEFKVPDWFAAAFVKEFYSHILSGETVGDALSFSRHRFITEQGNPLGLAYTLYSSPAIRFA